MAQGQQVVTPVAATPTAPVVPVASASSATAASQTEGNTATQTANKAPAATGHVRRVQGLSIKIDPIVKKEVHEEPLKPAKEINAETLPGLWQTMMEKLREQQPRLVDMLKTSIVRFEDGNNFAIVVDNSFVESEIKPHLLEILTIMREDTAQPMLNCHVVIEAEEREAVIYHPRDKYDAMVKNNPMIETFRILFPEVDY